MRRLPAGLSARVGRGLGLRDAVAMRPLTMLLPPRRAQAQSPIWRTRQHLWRKSPPRPGYLSSMHLTVRPSERRPPMRVAILLAAAVLSAVPALAAQREVHLRQDVKLQGSVIPAGIYTLRWKDDG